MWSIIHGSAVVSCTLWPLMEPSPSRHPSRYGSIGVGCGSISTGCTMGMYQRQSPFGFLWWVSYVYCPSFCCPPSYICCVVSVFQGPLRLRAFTSWTFHRCSGFTSTWVPSVNSTRSTRVVPCGCTASTLVGLPFDPITRSFSLIWP